MASTEGGTKATTTGDVETTVTTSATTLKHASTIVALAENEAMQSAEAGEPVEPMKKIIATYPLCVAFFLPLAIILGGFSVENRFTQCQKVEEFEKYPFEVVESGQEGQVGSKFDTKLPGRVVDDRFENGVYRPTADWPVGSRNGFQITCLAHIIGFGGVGT